MNIKIDKTKITDFDTDSAKGLCNEALDKIWTEEWLTRSVTKADKEAVQKTETIAELIKAKNKKVVFVAGGEMGVLLRAVKDLHPADDDMNDIFFMGDSLSPSEYADVINELGEEEFVIVAVAGKDDGIAVRSAYATLKQMLISRFGIERTTEDIFVISSDKEHSVAVEAAQNDYTVIYAPEGIREVYGAGTEPVLLLLTLMGGDAEKYLDGFRDMLSSPLWDLDGADYSIMRGLAVKQGYRNEKIVFMQKQFEGLGKWMEEFQYGLMAGALQLPAGIKKIQKEDIVTYISVERDEEDIMMPFFEGCHGDGSLNLMINEEGNTFFFEEIKEIPGVKLSLEWLDSYNLGQLTAFIQLSNSITEYFYNN